MSRNCSPVIFVPGIGGSRLRNRNTGKVVWGNLETMFGDLQKISLPDRDTDLIEATEVIDKIVIFCPFQTSFYGEIETFLCKNLSYARDKDLFFFCYDWRQDCAVSAEKLKEYIGERYDQLGKKLTIVAHSMGGLIARYCTDCLEAHQYVDKIIALGTPHRGSPNALESLLKGACVFPGGFRRQETLKCLKTFPSAYQLLPTLGSKEVYIQDDHMSPVDIFKELDWLGTKSEQSQYGSLVSNAKIFHDRLTKARSNSSGRLPTIYSVYGYGQHTLMQITVPRDDSNRWNLASYFRNRNGDKTVPEDSAIFYRNPNQICLYPSLTVQFLTIKTLTPTLRICFAMLTIVIR
jgi:pimeloyl-ACP methyl ester carboxylesterase